MKTITDLVQTALTMTETELDTVVAERRGIVGSASLNGVARDKDIEVAIVHGYGFKWINVRGDSPVATLAVVSRSSRAKLIVQAARRIQLVKEHNMSEDLAEQYLEITKHIPHGMEPLVIGLVKYLITEFTREEFLKIPRVLDREWLYNNLDEELAMTISITRIRAAFAIARTILNSDTEVSL